MFCLAANKGNVFTLTFVMSAHALMKASYFGYNEDVIYCNEKNKIVPYCFGRPPEVFGQSYSGGGTSLRVPTVNPRAVRMKVMFFSNLFGLGWSVCSRRN